MAFFVQISNKQSAINNDFDENCLLLIANYTEYWIKL